MDRRTARTRQRLQHALLDLIRSKDFDAISVRDLCRAAKVGRSTFYAHYTSKDHLKRSGLDHLRQQLLERVSGPDGEAGRRFGFSLALFEHAQDHLHIYAALAGGRGGAVALATIKEIIVDVLRRDLTAQALSRPNEAQVQFIAGGLMSLLTWWLDRGCQLSAIEMDEMFQGFTAERDVPRPCV